MMGFGHGESGFCAGVAVGDGLALPPVVTLTLGLAGAGAAVLCDIDCKGSTAESAFGPVSAAAHYGAIELHYMAAAMVDPEHEDRHSAHRGLTHWWPWWIVVGGAVALGCELSRWTSVGVLIVLFTLAVRALTIPSQPSTPQHRFAHPHTHQAAMTTAYYLMQFTPLWWLHKARKHVNRTTKIGGDVIGFKFGIGKLLTFLAVSGVVLGANYVGQLPQLGPWLGLLVWAGHLLHWIGDSPTEMGVPGFYLTKFWRLPKWIAFKAGGPFEIIALWIPMGLLSCYLILGALGMRPHAEVVTVLWYVAAFFGGLVTLVTIATMCTNAVKRRSYA
jgi:hypothetical protein